MAIISSYPTIKPTSSDLVLVVDTSEDGNPTKTATVGSINAIAVAPEIVTTKVSITDAQIQTLGTSNVTLVTLPSSGQAIQIISVAIYPNGTALGQNYSFTGMGVISWDPGSSATSHKAVIPTTVMDQIGGAAVAGIEIAPISSGDARLGANLLFGTSDDADPTNSGTANGGCDLYITYKILS